jgi:hypothetical protein
MEKVAECVAKIPEIIDAYQHQAEVKSIAKKSHAWSMLQILLNTIYVTIYREAYLCLSIVRTSSVYSKFRIA